MDATLIQLESIHRLKQIPEIETKTQESDEGKLWGVTVYDTKGFYLAVNYIDHENMKPLEFHWQFASDSPLPAKCRSYHYTLRDLVHKALNWHILDERNRANKQAR